MNWLQFLLRFGRNQLNLGRDTASYNRARIYGALALVNSLPNDIVEQIIERADMQAFIDELNSDPTADNITMKGE
jgi:hypothetical protein